MARFFVDICLSLVHSPPEVCHVRQKEMTRGKIRQRDLEGEERVGLNA